MKRLSLIFFLLSLIISTNIGQVLEYEISITVDEFPQDISWEILDNRSVIIFSGSLDTCDAFERCTESFLLDTSACYTLIVRDKFGDGIKEPGGYKISQSGNIIIEGTLNGKNAQHDLSCGIGESCKMALPLNLPTPPNTKIKAPRDKDYWFSLIPTEFGLYRITTCVNLISGQGYPDTKLWIYDTCDRDIISEGAEGALGYSDDFIQCEPASAFHYFPLDAEQEYLIRIRREMDQVEIDSIELKIVKLPSILGCTDPASCNFNPYANIDDGNCEYDETCGPDLRLDEEELKNSLIVDTITTNDECLVAEGCLRGPGPREVIRFSTKIDNIGTTDYILGSPEEAGNNFSKNNCHGHWHQDGYAEYLLFDGEGVPEPLGFKTGFCVLDLECNFDIPKYICSFMGISAGCSDIYDNEIECQWIDITDVSDGVYTLVVRVNWNRYPDMRGFKELDFENNWGQVCFNLDRSSGKTLVTILDSCPQYQDCLGFSYGQAEIDCEGICGGTSHYGDINHSGELDASDIGVYMSLLENGSDENSPCYDLNGDGTLNIYDAVLTHKCHEANTDVNGNFFHNHCIFPSGFINQQETVFVRIAEHNEAGKYFDIEIWAQSNDLAGIELSITGTMITNVEKMYDQPSDYFVFNINTIYALHGTNSFSREIAYAPFARVFYEEIHGDDVCIDPTSMIINASYDQISILLEEFCIFSSATKEEVLISQSIKISPNPTDEFLYISSPILKMAEIDLMDVSGKLLQRVKSDSNNFSKLSLARFQNGIYLIRIQEVTGRSIIKKVVKSSN